MSNKTLIAGLVGFFSGAVIIPDYGWLLGAVLGGCLGQLLHVTARLQELESRFSNLTHTSTPAAENLPTQEAPSKLWGQPQPLREPEPVAALSPVAASVSAAPPPSVAVPAAPISHAEAVAGVRRPASPTLAAQLLARVRDFFLQGNPIVRMGMVVMLFGLSFLVKYAAGAGLFPIQLRLVVIALIAVALLLIGWRTRHQQNRYGLVLQGGGVGALYLTIFAAAKFYALFPTGLAFALMLIVVTLGGLLAVLQNAQILAIMAAMGGFLAPVLLADGSGSHTMLFSFYLLLNLGVLGVALFKTWRWLNWLGFVFTFVISSVWGVLSYEPHLYGSTQPFLIAFFALYLCVSVLFSLKQPPQLRGLVDGSLIFGLPLVGFGLQAGLMNDSDDGLAVSAVILSAIYLLLAGALWKHYAAAQRLLIEAFIALGVGFATLAIPLALDADWTSAAWALEAAALTWVGLRQQRLLPRLASYGLYLAAVIALFEDGAFEAGHTPIISGDFIGFSLLALAALMIAYLLHVYRTLATRQELSLQWLPIAAGLLWWLVAGINEIETHIHDTYVLAALLTFVTLSLASSNIIAGRQQWPALARAGYSLLPIVILILLPFLLLWLFNHTGDWHPATNLPALLLFAVVQYRFLWRQSDRGRPTLLRAWHITTAWLWLVLAGWEAVYWQRELGSYYAPVEMATVSSLLWFICLAAPLIVLMALAKRSHWPFTQYRHSYQQVVPAPALILLGYWFLLVCQYPSTTSFLHIPVLNPLDLAQLAVILLFVYAVKSRLAGLDRLDAPLRYGGLAVLSFTWMNVLVLRTAHHYGGVPYERFALWDSATVQMALSIVWTLCALGVMLGSRRLASRPMWMAGAGLLALVVVKLFTKDLSGSGTLPQVISFMAVGALMLIIGYLSPLPASTKSRTEEATS
jgi:uncharacterized membrane protein